MRREYAGLGGGHLSFPPLTQDDLLGADGGEEVANRQGQAISDEGVQDPVGVSALFDEAGVAEDAEVPGDGGNG